MSGSMLRKRIPALLSLFIVCFLVFAGCDKSDSDLSKTTIERIAKKIFAESNYCQNAVFMSDGDYEFLNISYSNDKYNRYLVCIDLKTSVGAKYEKLPIYIFFRYNTSTDQYAWSQLMIFSDEYSVADFKKAVNWNKETTWRADEESFRQFLDRNKSDDADNDSTITSDDVRAEPPAEWDEMPLHKCIYCGGTARLASGGWCCDQCSAAYGDEDFVEWASLDTFTEGTWWDTDSQRCHLTIETINDETVRIEINWSSSASENTRWIITAKWDSYFGLLRYEEGIRQNINDTGTSIVYDDGSGFFYINSGKLYWVDYRESAGFNCAFEY